MEIIHKDCIFNKKYLKDEEKDGFDLIYENWDNLSILEKPTFGEVSSLLRDIPLTKITSRTKEILKAKNNVCSEDISNNCVGFLYKCMSYINNGNNHVIDFNLLKIKIKDIAENSKPDEYKLINNDIKIMNTKSNEEKIKFIYNNDMKMKKYINIKYTEFSILFGEAINGIKRNNYLNYNKYCELLIHFSKGYISAHVSILIMLEELFDRKINFVDFQYDIKNIDKTLYDYIVEYFNIKCENKINKEINEYYNNKNNFINLPTFSELLKKDFRINVDKKFNINYDGKTIIVGRLNKKNICVLNQLAIDSVEIKNNLIFNRNNEFTSILWFYYTLFRTPESFKLGCEYNIITDCNYEEFIGLTHNYSTPFDIITNYNIIYFYLQKDYYSFKKSFSRDFKIQYFYNSFALSATFLALLISFTGIIQVIQGFLNK